MIFQPPNSSNSFDAEDLLIQIPILSQCLASVVIPVRDEAENLAKTLKSVSAQFDSKGSPLDPRSFEIIILANNCRDNSAEIARQWQKKSGLPPIHVAEINLRAEDANIGFARRLLMNEAYHRLKTNNRKSGIIMSTDGDTQVAPDWIAVAIDEIENGADAVGGRIIIDNNELLKLDKKTRVFHLLDEKYRLLAAEFESYLDPQPCDSFPRHHQHFNGSFAVTTAAFEKAGGIPDVKFLEDVAFYNSLLRVDAKFRHSPQMRVFTSARNAGRTELGLSTQLKEWQIMGQNSDVYLVESADALEKKFAACRNLRLLQQNIEAGKFSNFTKISSIANNLCVSSEWIFEELEKRQTFGSLMEKIADEQAAKGEWNRQNPLTAVENAIFELKRKLKKLRLSAKPLNQTA